MKVLPLKTPEVEAQPPAPQNREDGAARAAEPNVSTATAAEPAEESQSLIGEALSIIGISCYAIGKVVFIAIRTIYHYLRFHPIHAISNCILLLGLALVIVTGSEIHRQMILSRISDQTIDRIIEASSYTREFDALSANREGAKEFFRVGAPEWIQRESIRAILYHARKADLNIEDQAVLLATAEIESGFNPMARAPTTTACGLFQFVQRTGEIFSLSPGDCMDPWRNAKSGAEHYIANYQQRVKPRVEKLGGIERAFKTFELSYYLHHDGPASNNPSNDLKALVLTGSDFLFKVYHVLQEEAVSEQKAPTFAEIFSANLRRLADQIYSFVVDTAHAADPAVKPPMS